MIYILDIETTHPPADDTTLAARVAVERERVKAPSNYGPDAAAAYIAKAREACAADVLAAAPLDPTVGMVACVGVMRANDESERVVLLGDFRRGLTAWDAELHTLLDLADYIGANGRERPVWVAHNGGGFDLPFLQARSIVHAARCVSAEQRHTLTSLARSFGKLGGKPWDAPLIDTCALWPATGSGGKRSAASLSAICAALGITRAPSIPSAAVPREWAEGDRGLVRDHLEADVRELAAVYRMLSAVM